MFINITYVKRRGKVYEYPRLLESYRRKSDGMPTHRVVANLSHLSPQELENLETALEASRLGKKVVVVSGLARNQRQPTKPAANLRYLDVAVLLELWKQWGLDTLLDDLMPIGGSTVAPSAVVTALTIQRCVDPGSTFYAESWFPRTALPELLGISPKCFNNTRLHRVLDGLDQCGHDLQAKLPRRYAARQGAFAAMFLDVTDTWFVGHGPKIAERAKTKEGFVRRKVGLVLLCNDEGYPLRWEVIRGKESDKEAMPRMARSISGLDWVGDAVLVCDRAMGNTAHIRQLLDTKLRFLTALVSTEFDSYTNAIPSGPLSDFYPDAGEDEKHVARAAELAERTGLEKVEDKLYVLDLEIIERPADSSPADSSPADSNPADSTPHHGQDHDPTVKALWLGREVRQAVADGRAPSIAAAGRALGIGKDLGKKYRRLANLSEQVQLAVLAGKAKGVSIAQLLSLLKHDEQDAQQKAFEHLVTQATARGGKSFGVYRPPKSDSTHADERIRVRAVAYFNPEVFVQKRRTASKRLEEIDAFITALNQRLRSPRAKMTEVKILAEVHRKLQRYDLIEAYDVHVDKRVDRGRTSYVVKATLNQQQWASRRRYDGFSLLVAHPEVKHSASELCRLYRAKDAVEKDFETIKSLVKLRPVWHRIDAKVRAHVDLCMLALLLERTLNQKLG